MKNGELSLFGLIQLAGETEDAAKSYVKSLEEESCRVNIPSYGSAVWAPTKDIGTGLQDFSTSLSQLDQVLDDTRKLSNFLKGLNDSTLDSVTEVRTLNEKRQGLQAALDKVHDLLELSECTEGVQENMKNGNYEAAAMNICRFRAIEKTFPVPPSDIAVVTSAEKLIVEKLVQDLDQALAAHRPTVHDVSSPTPAGLDSVTTSPAEANEQFAVAGITLPQSISRCCELLAVLGHGKLSLSRFEQFLSQSLRAKCDKCLIQAAIEGIDGVTVAINTVSALFAAASQSLKDALQFISSLQITGDSSTLLTTIVSVISQHVSRVVQSFIEGVRVRSALRAREFILAQQPMASPTKTLDGLDFTPSESDVAAVKRALQTDSATPFVLRKENVDGLAGNFVDPALFESLLDELTILLQRLISFSRLVQGYQDNLITIARRSTRHDPSIAKTLEEELRKAMEPMSLTISNLSTVCSAIEMAALTQGCLLALNNEEVVESGLVSSFLELRKDEHDLPAFMRHPVPAMIAQLHERGVVFTTLVEDYFFLINRSLQRSLSSGCRSYLLQVINGMIQLLQGLVGECIEARNTYWIELGVGKRKVTAADAISKFTNLHLTAGADVFATKAVESAVRVASILESAQSNRESIMAISKLSQFQSSAVHHKLSPHGNERKLTGHTAETQLASREQLMAAYVLNTILDTYISLVQLVETLSEEIPSFAANDEDLHVLNDALNRINDLSQAYQRAVVQVIGALHSRLLPRLRSALHSFEGENSVISYNITEKQFESLQESMNPIFTEVLPQFGKMLAPYLYHLTPVLACSLVDRFSDTVARFLEAKIKRKVFTLHGGYAFDTDLRAMIDFCIERGGPPVRQAFTRLLVLSAMFQSESVEDAVEEWKAAEQRERYKTTNSIAEERSLFTVDEVKSLLSLRRDFPQSLISKVVTF